MIYRALPAAVGRRATVDFLRFERRVAGGSRLLLSAVAALGLLMAACGQAAPASPTPQPELTSAPVASAPAAQPSSGASPPAALGVPSPGLAPSPAAANPAATGGAAKIPTFDEQAVADFYRGKTIHIVVGFGAGGGYDVYARLIARYLGKYLPGNPTVIVDNMPGAGSAVALAQIYNTLPRDGTVIGSGDGTLALQQILGAQSFDFDNSRWTYVGAPSIYEYFYVVSKAGLARAGITSVEDHLGPNGKQLVVGNTGPGVGLTATQMMISIAGANIKNVLGYAGTAAFRLAVQQGEIDGFFTSWDSIKATESTELANGEHVLFVQFPKEPVRALLTTFAASGNSPGPRKTSKRSSTARWPPTSSRARGSWLRAFPPIGWRRCRAHSCGRWPTRSCWPTRRRPSLIFIRSPARSSNTS